MKSFKTCNHLCLYQSISKDSDPVSTACLHCFNLSILCMKMENHPKCAECVRRGHPCVSVLWESLDHTHNKLEFDLSVAEKELARALTRVACLHKTLKHTKDKVAEKALCLACELADDNDGVSEDEDDPGPSNLLSSNFWDGLISAASPPRTAEASSHSWVSYSWVPMCFPKHHTLSIWWGSGLPH